MNIAGNVVEVVSEGIGTVFTLNSFVRDASYHQQSMETAKKIHENEISQDTKLYHEERFLSRTQHDEEIKVEREAVSNRLNASLEQHFHQLNADLTNAIKESERDMYDQRNDEFQTLILCSTVMFAVLSTVIIQGQLPSDLYNFVYIFFASVSGLSFALLFFCLVLCTKIVLRGSLFMYGRANMQSKRVRSLIQQTINLMGTIRNQNYPLHDRNNQIIRKIHDNFSKAYNKKLERKFSQKSLASVPNVTRSESNLSTAKSDSAIVDIENGPAETSSTSNPITIDRYDSDHGSDSNSILEEGEMDLDRIRRYDHVTIPGTFEHFWKLHCDRQGKLAVYFFYLGSAFMLVSVAIFMFSWFYYYYKSYPASYIWAIIIGLSMIIGLVIVFFSENEPGRKRKKLL